MSRTPAARLARLKDVYREWQFRRTPKRGIYIATHSSGARIVTASLAELEQQLANNSWHIRRANGKGE